MKHTKFTVAKLETMPIGHLHTIGNITILNKGTGLPYAIRHNLTDKLDYDYGCPDAAVDYANSLLHKH